MPSRTNTQKRAANVKKGLEGVPGDPNESGDLKTALEKCESMFRKILDTVDPEKVQVTSTNDLYKISTGLAGIVKARIELERWQAEKNGMFSEAKDMLVEVFWATFHRDHREIARVAEDTLIEIVRDHESERRKGEPEHDEPIMLE